MEEQIDILMATYNSNIEYLKKQIESILNQTYKNIKLIISDDNSTNKEVQEELKKYQIKDKRIDLYIQEKNLGYTKNFGFLLEKSTAKYIMFSDHDDIWYENKVQKSLEKLKKENVDLIYVNSNQINEKGEKIQENYFKYKNVPLINKESKLAISRCAGIGCSQIFTESVKEKMIPFKDSVMAHDWLAGFIANELKGLTYIEEPLFGYRLHNTNVFGGRSFSQNIDRWKKENGNSYRSYLKYRKEKVIDKAYLDGAKMCNEYRLEDKNKKFIDDLVRYLENIEKSKYVNWHLTKYFKFFAGKNLLKKMIKEIMIFHFPILGYIVFKYQ